MSFSESYRKTKVVAKNLSSAFGAVGTQMAGGVLGGKKTAQYVPTRYKPSRSSVRVPIGKLGTVKLVAKKLGNLSAAHKKYGFEGTPQLKKGQQEFFFGTSGRAGKATTEYFGKGFKEVKYAPAGLKNPHFKYNKI